ncbi:thioredoxin [Cenarchaeum symbiosum A]|uniref:Thioredoxin n=1 Tax=Cenarchaeum symbiosum (strain A) TaxID=414004 RepID=A0RUX0_CENSY|nr:thioredoxin [Cenarchaeum symbiosum A]
MGYAVPNSLIHETSPYLLQHAQNPVEWYAWNKEALGRAVDEDKPIFLSIGYSACHWCHVMAHESFENENIADIMNENFINIKVDREERPDIDDIYQKGCQLATGQGGWPLSAFLTPDRKPFYIGTYIPPSSSHGRNGFESILRQLSQAWKEKPGDIKGTAEKFLETLRGGERATAPAEPDRSVLDEAAVNLLQMADTTHGGFGRAPKFPGSANISFLFRYGKLSGISKFTRFALLTLDRMARGGIFDQVGGGFHRYSTDERWLAPHFEKMLYDNALIPVNYAEAYQVTGSPAYLRIMEKTLDYVLRELSSPEGGFYSSQDADTEGEEGRYYVWSKKEVKEILGADADAFCMFYDVTDGGNWEGKTILYNGAAPSAVAFQCGITVGELDGIIERSAAKLLEARSGRVPPGLDDKVLASWNSLMVTALARGYRASGEARYLDAARRCLGFIDAKMHRDGALMRTYKGEARIPGYLDDHAYYGCALLDAFEVDAEERYLRRASEIGSHLVQNFWDEERGGFFMTSDVHEGLIVRPRSGYDLSLPSGNSAAAHLMLRLYHLTGDESCLKTAERTMSSQAQAAAENPFAFGHMLNVMYMHILGPAEITVLDKGGEIPRGLAEKFLPEALLINVASQGQLDALSRYPFFAGKSFGGNSTAYICRNKTCSAPQDTMNGVEALL